MPYCTLADVRAMLTPGGGDNPEPEGNGTAAEMSNAKLTEFVELSQSYIDGRLAKRYNVPVTPTPELLAKCCAAMAQWHATLAYRERTELEFNDPVMHRYRWAQQVLNEIDNGIIELFPDSSAANDAVVFNRWGGELFKASDYGLSFPGDRGEFGSVTY